MKGILHVVAALLLLNVAALTLWSRAAPPTASAKSTRVGVYNQAYVVKNYEKFKRYQVELKNRVDPFQKIDTDKKEQGSKLSEELKDSELAAERRKEIEKELTKIQREIEDNKKEAQAVLIKAQERQLQSLYGDIEAVVRRLATNRGLDLVMHYNDALTETERKSAPNIARKMQAGAFMPVFIEPSIELSEVILEELHKDMEMSSAARS